MPKLALSNVAQAVWAKSHRDDDSALPLHMHMSDSAAVAGLLWDLWLPNSVKRTITKTFNNNPSQARSFVTWMAAVHDLGKASPAFSVQVELLANEMKRQGLKFPLFENERKHAPHSVVSHILLQRWLMDKHGWSSVTARTVAVIPGGHHGVPPSESDLADAMRRPEWLGDSALWLDTQRELADYAAAVSGANLWLTQWGNNPIPVTVQVLTTAIVIVSDWIASDDDLFPYGNNWSSTDRAQNAWKRLRLPSAWHPGNMPDSAEELFLQRFSLPPGAELRPVQHAAVAAARNMKTPGLLIIEANMGEGKTEAALAAAEILAFRTGAGGCIVALPTMATSDAMFSRVHDWLDRVPDARGDGTQQTAFLAHGKARLNEEFQGIAQLRKLAAIGDNYGPTAAGSGLSDAILVAHEWLFGRKKGVLANFVVGTIDQVLFGALKSKHLVLRHLALVNKIVIIDEVHAADFYMSVYLRRILSWLGAYGVPVILLSATLPPASRRALAEAYAEGSKSLAAPTPSTSLADRKERSMPATGTDQARAESPFSPLSSEEGYPVVSTISSDGEVKVESVTTSSRTSTVVLETIADDNEVLAAFLESNLADGGCAGIIRNTVKRAQETAAEISLRFPGVTVLLAHSRFVSTHRMHNENYLREILGPPTADRGESRRPEEIIVVGTQVLEQSLDIDFDIMVSDLAPMDLLLQRMGRLHRHKRKTRPSLLSKPRFILSGVDDWGSLPPTPVAGSVYVYQLFPLLRALAVLQARLGSNATVSLPGEIAPLVRAAYRDDYIAPPGWEDALSQAESDWNAKRVAQEHKATTFLLGPVGRQGTSLVDWVRAGAGDADEDSPDGQAQVRDTEDSIEVLVVQRIDNELHVLPDVGPRSATVINPDWNPEYDIALAIANSSIRLPPKLCRRWRVDRTIGALEGNAFPGWQQSSLLKGQLVLVLDENLEAVVDGSRVRYSLERGMEIDEPRKDAAA